MTGLICTIILKKETAMKKCKSLIYSSLNPFPRCPQKRDGVPRYKDYLFVPKDKEMLATVRFFKPFNASYLFQKGR